METQTTTIQKLKSDASFALRFALDNNFPAIQAKLAAAGYNVTSSAEAYNLIAALIAQSKLTEVRGFFNVPYINEATNGTGGYKSYFVSTTSATDVPVQKSFNWAGLLTTVGIVLTGAGVAISGTNAGTAETPEQKAAREKAEAEAEAKKKFWMWFFIILGTVALGTILYFVFRPKKEKK